MPHTAPMGTTHVIGAGVAGLSAALATLARGRRVVVYEAATPGGRARALSDGTDNGTHALLGANRAALRFLRDIGARDAWVEPEPGGLPVLDVSDGVARCVALSPLGWWRASRRPPGLTAGALVSMLGLAAGRGGAMRDRAVGAAMAAHPAFLRGFVEPLVVAALNTPVAEASSRRLAAVLRRVGAPGAARLFVARHGLGPDMVEPAVAAIEARGGEVRTGARLRALMVVDGAASVLSFGDASVDLAAGDTVVLAPPPWEVARLLPGTPVPAEHAPILNLHFDHPTTGPIRFLGVLGGLCQWVLVRPGGIAVTVSAADAEQHEATDDLAPRAWGEIQALAAAFGLPGRWPEAPPPCRTVKERRATPRHAVGAPPPPAVRVLRNTALAGDWTDPVLPATLEAAVRSGGKAVTTLAD